MTGPHENDETRPISVAELLARNGNIGGPPVGGRRRRRRGNADAVSVAELTGEIPVIRDDDLAAAKPAAAKPAPTAEEPAPAEELTAAEPAFAAAQPAPAEPEADDDLVDYFRGLADVSAEEMRPDTLEHDADESSVAVADYDDEVHDEAGPERDEDQDEVPSYLRAPTVVLERTPDSSVLQVPPETTTARELEDEGEPPTRGEQLLRGAAIVGQSIVAVAVGAGLFYAFDELWRWNNIVALVLSVLVILGLVVGVRIVRKTEDIGSTLIAVAVGALVTLGPLALLKSN